MMLRLSPRSPFVRKVMIAIHELGLADRVRTVVAPTKVNDALLADSPLCKLPTPVLDDGFPLFDARVIVEYLDDLRTDPGLIPDAGRARLVALRDQALGDGIMDVALLGLSERRRGGAGQSEPLVTVYRAKLAASLARLEGGRRRPGGTDLRRRAPDAGNGARLPRLPLPGGSLAGGPSGARRLARRFPPAPVGARQPRHQRLLNGPLP